MIQPVRQRPSGGMKKDVDPQDYRNGDYLDAKNITRISDADNNTFSVEPILGNENVFTLPKLTAQNKKYRLYPTPNNTPSTYGITVTDQNGDNAIAITFACGANLATALSNCDAAVTTALGATVSTTIGTDYVQVEFVDVNYADYQVALTDSPYAFFPTYGDMVIEVYQEAIDVGMAAGTMKKIGSYDLLGDLFLFCTPTDGVESFKNISTITAASVVTTTTAHGLLDGYRVRIEGTGNPLLDGKEFIIDVTSTTKFTLLGVTAGSLTAGGKAYWNYSGFGVIAVAKKNLLNFSWGITKLLASSELGFTTQHQIDVRCEKDSQKVSLYWTDDNEKPRAMYYYGSYTTNGFINAVYDSGIYSYGSINEATGVFGKDINVRMYLLQDQTGGNLVEGNYRYSVRLLDENLVPTEWSYLTNPIPVYTYNNGDSSGPGAGLRISGDVVLNTINTKKVNNIKVSNINKNVFKYIELAAVHYNATGFSGVNVKRQTIVNDGGFVEDLTHTGFEQGTTVLDLAELGVQNVVVDKAKNIEIIDNRLVFSNLEVVYDKDLSDFFQTLEYSIEKDLLTDFNDGLPVIDEPLVAHTTAAEYQVPETCVNNTGYCLFETYRIGARVKWKNGGGWSKGYLIDDVTIDWAASGRRQQSSTIIADFYKLQQDDYTELTPFSYFIQMTNIDLNYQLSDGTYLYEHIEEIEFLRAECIKEVIATGIAVTTTAGAGTVETSAAYFSGGSTAQDKKNFNCYFPDYFLDEVDTLAFEAGDYIKAYDTASIYSVAGNYYRVVSHVNDLVYNGYQDVDIVSSVENTVSGTGNYTFKYLNVTLDTDIINGMGPYCSYFHYIRPKTNKYGNVEDTEWITTGCLTTGLTGVTTSTTYDIYGGDTFTQKTLIKSVDAAAIAALYPGSVDPTYEPAIGMYFASQNRANANLKNCATASCAYPGASVTDAKGLGDALKSINYYEFVYNEGYTPKNEVQTWLPYNENVNEYGDLPVRIVWSEAKVYGSQRDSYRDFPALNYKDLDLVFGEINGMMLINGNLMTWQPRNYQFQYFNSNNILSTGSGSEVLVGDAGVMSRRPNDLSHYGTYHKWSIVKGRSKGGKDVVYWCNTEHKKFLRFGADGTVVLSDEKLNRAFFANTIYKVHNYDTPTYSYGITGVYHERFSDCYFTFLFPLKEGGGITNYTIVFNEVINEFTTFLSCRPRIYGKYMDSIISPSPYYQNEIFEHNRDEYAKWYCTTPIAGGNATVTTGSKVVTLSTSTATIMPIREDNSTYYLTIDGVVYRVDTIDSTTQVTLLDAVTAVTGTYAMDIVLCSANDPYIEMIINADPNTSKRFIATQMDSDNAPYKVELRTEQHMTTIDFADFETREDFHYAPIFNDELSTGDKTDDTSSLFGRWIKTKVFFKIDEYNKFYNFVITLYDRFRNYKR